MEIYLRIKAFALYLHFQGHGALRYNWSNTDLQSLTLFYKVKEYLTFGSITKVALDFYTVHIYWATNSILVQLGLTFPTFPVFKEESISFRDVTATKCSHSSYDNNKYISIFHSTSQLKMKKYIWTSSPTFQR